jgi:hypothetical protein
MQCPNPTLGLYIDHKQLVTCTQAMLMACGTADPTVLHNKGQGCGYALPSPPSQQQMCPHPPATAAIVQRLQLPRTNQPA